MSHPDNVDIPDDLDVPIHNLIGIEGIANELVGIGCAIRRSTNPLEVYVPAGFDDDDLVATYNDIIHAGYVVTRAFPMPESKEFSLKLELIPVMSSAYRDIVLDAAEGDAE